jgi:hypothetical protein
VCVSCLTLSGWVCVRAFYQVSMGVSNFVYFYVYNALKNLLWLHKRRTGKSLGYLGDLAISTIAGIINVLVREPSG